MKIVERLNALRALMQQKKIAAYMITTDDDHGSEYVGDYFKAREYMSGFTGSAGTLVVLMEKAYLWTDGRYFLQAASQLKGSTIELMRIGEPDVPSIEDFVAENLPEGSILGFNGRTVTSGFAGRIAEKTDAKKITFYDKEDLIDQIWEGRPAMSKQPVWELDVCYAGLGREEKIALVREKMAEKGADVLLISALDEIAWLLNLRGNDVAYTPVFLAYMLLTDKEAVLCVQEEILSDQIRQNLKCAGVTIRDYRAIEKLLADIPKEKTVWIDGESTGYSLEQSLLPEVKKISESSPVELLKAVKNPQEMQHIKEAHIKDGVAVTRFIRWLKNSVGREKITEITAAGKLEEFRSRMEGYCGQSFSPIIAYGEHGAIVHYAATAETDAVMEPKSFCLADTGGHYLEGSTDITRTIALGALTNEEKRAFTLVLKGHLRLGAARFLQGVCGQNLDVLARIPLWEEGLDYNHGTGHGVGYLLSVHEGPQRLHWRIRKESNPTPLEEGMVISNEPGLYLAGKFGIRHENLLLCRKDGKNEYGQFLCFEPLTMVPFDLDAVDVSLMEEREIKLLNDYHETVYNALSPYLDEEEREWLRNATRKL